MVALVSVPVQNDNVDLHVNLVEAGVLLQSHRDQPAQSSFARASIKMMYASKSDRSHVDKR